MKKMAFLFLVAGLAGALFAQERIPPRGTIVKELVTAEKLQTLLDSNYAAHSIDADGDLRLERNALKGFVTVDIDRALLRFYMLWTPSDAVSEAEAAAAMNKWNNEKVFMRGYYTGALFGIDYYLSFEGGIHEANFNDTLDWFFSLGKSFGAFLDGEGVL